VGTQELAAIYRPLWYFLNLDMTFDMIKNGGGGGSFIRTFGFESRSAGRGSEAGGKEEGGTGVSVTAPFPGRRCIF
jgi:hypothetical protein